MTTIEDVNTNLDVRLLPRNIESDEPELESYLHLQQMLLLIKCLDWWWRDIKGYNQYFAAGNMSIYYSPEQIKSKDFRGPDFFVVLDTQSHPRDSWVIWEEEGRYPNLIIELLSPSTANTDKGLKKQIYQDIFRTPEYFWFEPKSLKLVGLILIGGKYQGIEPNSQGLLWSQQLNLYLGVYEDKLRYFTDKGELVPTPEEFAKQEQQKAERLAAKLRELNINPESL